MSKQLLIETQIFKPSVLNLTEGKKSPNGNPIVEGILATAEIKNGNGRYYKKDLWEREIDKYMSSVKQRRACGELDHPESSVRITIGVSSRGMGSLKEVDGLLRVQDDFDLLCWDIVSTPSNPDSWMKPASSGMNMSMGLNESLNPIQNKSYFKVNSIITEILCSQGSCPIW